MKKTFPTLLKSTTGGNVQMWRIWVEENDSGTANILTEHGRVDGKKQDACEVIREGKNRGHSNATTAYQQACAEAESRWNMQLSRKGYGLTAEDSAATRARSPMLAYKYEDHRARVSWETAFAQPKLDGFRCLVRRDEKGKIQMTSRENQPILTLDHLVEFFEGINLPLGFTLDGELYCHDLPLNLIASACKRKNELSPKILYHTYDCIPTAVAKPMSFEDRYEAVKDLVGKFRDDRFALVETVKVRSEDELWYCQQQYLDAGYEGAILRHGVVGYAAGKRSANLLKVKTFLDSEFEIVDYKLGRGKCDGVPIFVCVTDTGHNFDVLAPGTMPEKKELGLRAKQCIGKKLTVKYQKMTSTDEPVPFLPVAKGFVET